MDSVYLVCAIAGGAILVLQFLGSLFGADAETDVDADGGFDGDAGDEFIKILSLKTLVSGGAFFGLSGLAARQFELPHGWALAVAVTAGLVAIYIVAWLMRSLAQLQSRGNVALENAVGRDGTCYLRIPARGSGRGQVHVSIQGRLVECKAITNGPEIPTGAAVRIVALHDPTTLEVAAG